MSRLAGVATIAAMCIAASIGVARADGWDVGDGSGTCHTYEICLFNYRGSTDSTAQFYYGEVRYLWGSGAVRNWWVVSSGGYDNLHVYDRTSMVRNRDSTCGVYLFEDSYYGGSAIYIPNDHTYWDVPSWLDPAYGGDNGISSHRRCQFQ